MKSFRLLSTLLGTLALVVLGATASLCATGPIQTFERDSTGVTLHSKGGVVRIDVCSDRIIHVIASPTERIAPAIIPSVIHSCQDGNFNVASGKSTVAIRTSVIEITIDLGTGALGFLSANGKTVLSEPADGGRTLTPATIDGTPTFQVQQEFLSPPDEALYGLGQHQEGFFNLRSIPLRLQQANTNISIPVLLSTKGYGLIWNNASLTDFNAADQAIPLDAAGKGTFRTGKAGEYGFLLSGNERDRLNLSVGGESIIDLNNMWVPDSAGAKIDLKADTEYQVSAQSGGATHLFMRAPSDTTEFRSEAGQAVDYYFLYGPQLDQVIARYREMTGTAPLLPRWAYGFWQCRERYSSQQQILDDAAEFRRRQIPVDVIVQDWQYWGKYGWNAMRFDESQYPDPEQMMSSLHRLNFHMVISVWAKFGVETEVDREMKKAHLLLTSEAKTGEPGEAKEQESWVDLFNPKAQKAFWSDIDRNLFSSGLDGWWLDASEPEGDPLKNDATYLDPGKFVRNAFPLFETSAVYNGQRATTESKRVVILSRSAFTGQQRNGSVSWSGDVSGNWETLRRQVPAGLSFSMSGFPYWTTDIGGFFRPDDQYASSDYRELLIRWFQFGAFCPIFRVHGYRSETEMWKYGPEAEKIITQVDDLRYRLLPYIYSTAWGVTDRGETMMQGLPLVYPNDASVRDITDEFLFGNSMLVSPVLKKGATTRSVVLPAGDDWVDFWTGRTLRGGQTVVVDAPLDRIPIQVKAGSIVPMGPVVQSAAEPEVPLEIRVYSGKDADFQLYDDSGDGYQYEHGARATVQLHWDDKSKTLFLGDQWGAIPEMPAERTFRIVLVKQNHGIGVEPTPDADQSVTYQGHKLRITLHNAGSNAEVGKVE